jgi:hypothetical protein
MAMTRFCPIARLLAGAMILLSGCSAIEGDYANVKCPDTGVISGLGTVSRFDGVGNGFANLAYRASLTKEKSDCAVDAGGVTIMLTLSTLAELGPTAPSRSADFPYFVAVTDDDDRIVAKRVFANQVIFKLDKARTGAEDAISERIPLADPKLASRYHVVLGFQLTDMELAFNRAHP